MNKSDLPDIGMPLLGGYFAGLLNSGGNTAAIIVSPKSMGTGEFPWGEYGTLIDGTSSCHDGKSNTKALAENGNPIGLWAAGLSINKHEDWYIPSRDELEIIYRNLKPNDKENYCSFRDGENPSAIELDNRYAYNKKNPAKTLAEIFTTTEALTDTWHWSSTQYSAYSAWVQDFGGGNQSITSKNYSYAVRAVRRELVI